MTRAADDAAADDDDAFGVSCTSRLTGHFTVRPVPFMPTTVYFNLGRIKAALLGLQCVCVCVCVCVCACVRERERDRARARVRIRIWCYYIQYFFPCLTCIGLLCNFSKLGIKESRSYQALS